MKPISVDVIVLGAGAAGLMCGMEAGARHRRVLILDKSNKVGKKILMSGGGRCNFTNLSIHPENYLSHNPHFCKSALTRYTSWDFIAMVERHKIAYHEKTQGQLFCDHKSSQIVEMLLKECQQHHVNIKLNQLIQSIEKKDKIFLVQTHDAMYQCQSLVVATGGLSIPTLGSSAFGYQVATQFGIKVYPTRAGLVPLTLHTHDKSRFTPLAGIAVDARVQSGQQSFRDPILFTHRGLSGPGILQISSYWQAGETLHLSLLPDLDLYQELQNARHMNPTSHMKTQLASHYPKHLLDVLLTQEQLEKPMKQHNDQQLQDVVRILHEITLKPNGTEGYRTAEVTLGGVDCHEISSQRFEAMNVPGLFFIGEVLDVTGWLGGYNFQWAWSSGWAAGQVV